MINVVAICVNYNSYEQLIRFLLSLDSSIKDTNDVKLKVYIADNSEEKKDIVINVKYEYKVLPCPNNGYFGSALNIYNSINSLQQYDYLIISNVDLEVDKSFFKELIKTVVPRNAGWIAPAIYSMQEKRDKNPQRITRPSAKKIKTLLFFYKYPIIEIIYKNTIYRLKRHRKQILSDMNIYCGHGSFIILTRVFLQRFRSLYFPCFLYCEELFLGELIRIEKQEVIYKSNLKVIDEEHCSTSLLSSSNYYKYNKESLKYFYKMN